MVQAPSCKLRESRKEADCNIWMDEIHFAPTKRPGMRDDSPNKFQRTMLSHGFQVVQDFVHAQYHGSRPAVFTWPALDTGPQYRGMSKTCGRPDISPRDVHPGTLKKMYVSALSSPKQDPPKNLPTPKNGFHQPEAEFRGSTSFIAMASSKIEQWQYVACGLWDGHFRDLDAREGLVLRCAGKTSPRSPGRFERPLQPRWPFAEGGGRSDHSLIFRVLEWLFKGG